MNHIKIYQCDNSVDGIFTAVYLAWSSKCGHANLKLEEVNENGNYSNLELFSEYIRVETDNQLSLKVTQSIKDKISEEAFHMIYRVALSNYFGKADLIYRFLILGFHMGSKVLEHLSNEVVGTVFRINKNVIYEQHHLLGFVRFSEQENGLLFSTIHPKNNVMPLIAPHFADRLPNERFIIYDETRNTAALHLPGKQWILAVVPELDKNMFLEFSSGQDEYSDLWKIFFQHITIKERINPKLQRNMLPQRFRGDMLEFNTSETNTSGV
jgi:probable DNA metabolism protein